MEIKVDISKAATKRLLILGIVFGSETRPLNLAVNYLIKF